MALQKVENFPVSEDLAAVIVVRALLGAQYTLWPIHRVATSCRLGRVPIGRAYTACIVSRVVRMPSIPGFRLCGQTRLQRTVPSGSRTNTARQLRPSSSR